MIYKALKDFGDKVIGDVINLADADTAWSPEELSEKLKDGSIEAVLEVGDACTTDDGKVGTLQQGDGEALVCVATPVEEEKKGDDEQVNTTGAAVGGEVAKKFFNGVEVVSDGFREVNGNQVRHIKDANGVEFDLTEAEYADQVK